MSIGQPDARRYGLRMQSTTVGQPTLAWSDKRDVRLALAEPAQLMDYRALRQERRFG